MPALKQSDIPNSAQKQYRAAASETAAENLSYGNIKAVSSVPGMAIQRQLVVQKKPGADDEPVQPKFFDTGVNTSVQAFQPIQPKQQTLDIKTATGTAHKVPFIQTKLTINAPGDQYEQEADTMADKVMRMPANGLPFSPSSSTIPAIQRRHHDGEDDEKVHRKETSSQPTEAGNDVSSYVGSLSSKGSPMPGGAKSFFESRFGRDFSDVKIHDDGVAAKSAQSINALAYTSGNNIVFNQNQFSPDTDSGKRLLAHELTHVVQQGGQSNRNIQKFESPEHVEIGDAVGRSVSGYILLDTHKRDLPYRTSAVKQWPAAMEALFNSGNDDQQRFLQKGLTYGEILALSGDFYETFDHLNKAPIKELFDLIPLIRGAASTKQLQQATGGRYMSLALRNQAHFSIGKGNNMETWKARHIEAILVAKAGNPGSANLAYAMNAAADHFLTDRFAAGHLLSQRNSNRSGISGVAKKLGSDDDLNSLSAKLDHDIDNEHGVKVENARGNHWTVLGDENWSKKENEQNRAFTLEATRLSVADIKDAISQGKKYPTPNESTIFNSEKIVPRVENATSLRAHDEPTRKAAFEEIQRQNPLKEMLRSRYLTPDDIVRDWLNRMDDTALRAQPLVEKIRMVKEVLASNIDDLDFAAFTRIYQISSGAEKKELRKAAAAIGSTKVNTWLFAMP